MKLVTEDTRIWEALKNIAFINVNKFLGKTSSDSEIVASYFQKNRELLKKQIDAINPDIVIAGNILSLFYKDFDLTNQDLKSGGPGKSAEYCQKNGRLFINAYHPYIGLSVRGSINRDKYTLLGIAAANGCTNIIQQLLDLNVKLTSGNIGGYEYSPLELATRNGHLDAEKLLLKAMPKFHYDSGPPWLDAAKNGDTEKLKALVKAGADVNLPATWDCLQIPAKEGYAEIVQILLKARKEQLHSQDMGVIDDKAFCLAAAEGHLDVVKIFVDFGAVVNEKVIQEASAGGKAEVVSYLKEAKKKQEVQAAEKAAAAEKQKQQEEAGLAAAQEIQRNNQMVFDWVFLIAGLAAIVTIIWCVIKAVRLSLNEKAVVFWGRHDLTVSIIFSVMTLISFLTLVATLTTDVSDRGWAPFILILLITGLLLVVSIKRSFAANLGDRKKTFIVVVAKLVFSFLAVFCFLITYFSISNTLSNKDSEGRRKSAGDFARDAMMMGFLLWCSKWAATGLFFLVKKNSLEDTVGGEPSSSDHNGSRETQSDSTANIAHCYHVLELKSGASLDQVKKAWRDLVLVWHPDRFPNNESLQRKAGERLKEINAAYEMLKQHLGSSEAAPA